MSNQFDDEFLKRLFKTLTTDPIDALEDCTVAYADAQADFYRSTYNFLGFLCAFVETIRQSPEDERSLYELPFWRGPGHKPKRDKLTLAAARVALGAKETRTALYQKALVYSQVIDHCAAMDIDPINVPTYLAENKINGVLKLFRDSLEGPSGETDDDDAGSIVASVARADYENQDDDADDDENDDDHNDTDDEDDDDPAVSPGNDVGPVGRTARPKISSAESSGGNNKGGSTSTTRKSYNLKLEDEIVFSAGRYFRVFYGSSEGDKISLTLQRKFDKDTGWWTFEVISVD